MTGGWDPMQGPPTGPQTPYASPVGWNGDERRAAGGWTWGKDLLATAAVVVPAMVGSIITGAIYIQTQLATQDKQNALNTQSIITITQQVVAMQQQSQVQRAEVLSQMAQNRIEQLQELRDLNSKMERFLASRGR